jgi:Flp pilus assembly protein TadD
MLALAACGAARAPEAPQATESVVDRSPRVASELARGRQALAAGDLQSAQAAFTAALRGSPNDPEPAIGLAETYLALGDLETAGRLFEVVAKIEGGAGDGRLLQGRGLVALGQGRTDEAIDLLEQSVGREPGLWRAWAGLGRAYGRQGKSRQARSAFGRAEEVAPSPAIVMNDVGMLHLEENDPAAALEAFQRALEVDPANATASANARIARAMLGDYDAAIAGARPEELPDVLNNVGYIAVVNGDFDVADRLLRRAIEISPVYHEAARANLDLLAQAMKGVPVLALAGADLSTERAAAGAELASVAAAPGGLRATGTPPARAEFGEAATEGWHAGLSDTAAGPVAPEPIPAGPAPQSMELASAPARGTGAGPAGGVMAHGFRWESQPLSAAKPAKRRGKRKQAKPDASPDAGDPRASAWPAILVPSDEPSVTASEPESDRQARAAEELQTAEREASTGAPDSASPGQAGPGSRGEPGWPE